MKWVFNASPLIILGRLGRLELLDNFKPACFIPRAVVDELLAGPQDDPAARWARAPRLAIIPPAEMDREVAAWDLGLGESAVISCCRAMPEAMAVLDDRAARNCAAAFSIPTTGTLGVLLRAKQDGLIGALKPELNRVLSAGSHLSASVIQKALELAGEAE